MEQLQRQVLRARRRLMVQQFFRIVGWWLFAALSVSALAIAVPKIWVLGFDRTESMVWTACWLGGTLGLGLLASGLCAFWARRDMLEAAIEVDRRFGLRERVSSSLALGPQERETEFGRALVGDACHRVQRVDVGSQFRVRPTWRLVLPLLPATAVCVLFLCVKDAVRPQPARAATSPVIVTKQVKEAIENVKDPIRKRREQAEQLGLQDAADLFNRLEEGVDKMSGKDDIDRRKASIQLNDLSKELKQRREMLGGTDQIKKQLDQLGNIDRGPADKIADSLKEGDFRKALDELDALKEQIEQDGLTDQEQQQLADQLEQMRDKLQEMADAHQAAREQLEQQIQQQQAQGNMDQVAKLQQQLDQLNQQGPQIQQMKQLADQLGECAQCVQDGNMQDAMAQLDQMAAGLEDLQRQVDELEMLDGVLDQIADAKDAMNCPECQGRGCKACRGAGRGGDGDNQGPPGMGLGGGRGVGAHPEKETDTQFYDSKVRTDPGPGAAVIVGRVHGPNVAGKARELIKSELEAARTESARPISSQKLPRAQREHAQQYFDIFREGEN